LSYTFWRLRSVISSAVAPRVQFSSAFVVLRVFVTLKPPVYRPPYRRKKSATTCKALRTISLVSTFFSYGALLVFHRHIHHRGEILIPLVSSDPHIGGFTQFTAIVAFFRRRVGKLSTNENLTRSITVVLYYILLFFMK